MPAVVRIPVLVITANCCGMLPPAIITHHNVLYQAEQESFLGDPGEAGIFMDEKD